MTGTPPDWERGACVVSIDTEMAWGLAHRRGGNGDAPQFDRERDVIGRMLDLFARYEVPATWAVVGHLFLDRCGPGGDEVLPDDPDGTAAGARLHTEMERPSYSWLEGDWFDIDPGSDRAAAPEFYGRDIVDRILACPCPQEVASHSFAHMLMDDPGCGPEVLASDLEASRQAAAACGVELVSYVYPRNGLAHLGELVAAGYTSYRGGRPQAAFAEVAGWARPVLRLVDRLRPLRGSAVWPEVHHDTGGLVNVPQTYLFAPDVKARRLPPALWARFPAARVHQAARHRSLCHLWFHPYNITAQPDRALTALEVVCRAMARERDRGRLDLLTMAQVAGYVNGDATPAGGRGRPAGSAPGDVAGAPRTPTP
jgi:peptidoglycan/xylan/chitin deacetylase (PgdA/CDA1 family)